MKVTKIAACVALVMFAGGCTLGVAGIESVWFLCPAGIVLLLALPLIAIAENAIDRKMHPEKYCEKKRQRTERKMTARREYEARMERYANERALKQEARRKAEKIVGVKLLGGGSEKNTRYGLKGAVTGGLFFGVPGAVIGSMIPKGTKQKQRFLVQYEDGHTEIKEVFPDTDECKKLLEYIKF